MIRPMAENRTNGKNHKKSIRFWWIAVVVIFAIWYGPFVAMIISEFRAYSLLIVLPITLALVAWARGWHLLAGVSMLMASLGCVWATRTVDNLDWFLLCGFLIVIPCSIGGIFNVLLSWRSKQRGGWAVLT